MWNLPEGYDRPSEMFGIVEFDNGLRATGRVEAENPVAGMRLNARWKRAPNGPDPRPGLRVLRDVRRPRPRFCRRATPPLVLGPGPQAPALPLRGPCRSPHPLMPRYPPSRRRASCGRVLAWASMAVATWERIWERTKEVISWATSTSEMRDSEACRFSAMIWRFTTA